MGTSVPTGVVPLDRSIDRSRRRHERSADRSPRSFEAMRPSSSRCRAGPAHHRACAHSCGGADRRNADRMAVGGRISEGPFVALVWFVGRRADEETSGRRRRDGRWRLNRRPESRDGGPSPRIRGRSLVGQTPGQVNHRDVADGAGMTRSTRRDHCHRGAGLIAGKSQ